jgi:hypothetical protein
MLVKIGSNAAFNFLHAWNKFEKIFIDKKNLFFFEKKNRKNKINRNSRSARHKMLLNFIYRQSKLRVKEFVKHDLLYLKPFEMVEFVQGDLDYELLPDGEKRDYYKNIEITEKLELLTKILQKAFKTQSARWRHGLKLIEQLKIVGKGVSNKSLEKEISDNKIMFDSLTKSVRLDEVVNNKDI